MTARGIVTREGEERVSAMTPEELAACPFCGGTAIHYTSQMREPFGAVDALIECADCRVAMGAESDVCVRQKWNRRDALAALSRELEEARGQREIALDAMSDMRAIVERYGTECTQARAEIKRLRTAAQEWATARQALIALEIAATKQNPLRDEIAASITRLAAAECSLRDMVAPSTKGEG